MTSSGLQCEVCVVHFRVKFVKVYEWVVGSDRLKIIFKSIKNKITKSSIILKIIKNDHNISLICCRKNIKM